MEREIFRRIMSASWTAIPNREVLLLGSVFLLAMFMGGCSGGPSFEKALERADAAYEAGEMEKARINYLNCYQKNSSAPHVLVRLGTIYMERKNYEATFYFLRRAVEVAPEYIEGRLVLARVSRALGGFKQARAQAEAILEMDPLNGEAMILYADGTVDEDGSISQELVQESFSKLGAMPEESKKVPEYQRALGTLYLRLGNRNRAEERFRAAMDLDPEDPGPFLDLANLYSNAGNIASANAMFAEAVSRSPDQPMTALRWARFRSQNGDQEGAREVLNDLIESHPEHAPSLAFFAEVEYNEKNYDRAKELADRAIAADSRNFPSLLIRAQIKLAKNDAGGAVDSFTELTNQFQNEPQVYYGLALAQAKEGDPGSAIENLSLAIEKAEERKVVYSDAILMRAELQLNMSDYESVIEVLPALIEGEPENVRAYNALARAYQMGNNDEQALQVYQTMREELGPSLEIEFAEGKLLAKMGRLSEAKERFLRGMESVPKSLVFLEELVDTEAKMGERSSALSRLETFENNYKDELEPSEISRIEFLRGAILKAQGDLEDAGAAFMRAAELNPENVSSLSELAQVFGALGRVDEAIDTLEGALSQNNDAAGLLLQLGLLHEQKEEYSAAATYYEKLLKVAPDTIVALNNLAYIKSEKLNDIPGALELAIKAHRIAAGNSGSGVSGSASYMANQSAYRIFTTDTLGWIRYRNGEYQEAYRLAKVVQESGFGAHEMRYHFALAAYMTGRLDEARNAIAQATTDEADFVDLEEANQFKTWLSKLDGIGSQYDLDFLLALDPEASQVEMDSALLAAVDERLVEQPEDVVALRLKALSSARRGELEAARSFVEKALSINPNYSSALYDAGVLDLVQKAWDDANGRLRQAREIGEASEGLLFALGVAAMETGDFDYSELLFERVSSDYRLWNSVQFRRAQTLLCKGDVENAETTLSALPGGISPVVERFKEICQALVSGGALESESNVWGASEEGRIAFEVADAIALELSGSVPESVSVYEKVLSRAPGAMLCAARLAGIYAESGENLDEARRYAANARAELGQSVGLARTSGLIAFRLGNADEAIAYLETARGAGSSDPTVDFALGILRLKSDPADAAARSRLTSAMESDPNHWLAPRANEALALEVEDEN